MGSSMNYYHRQKSPFLWVFLWLGTVCAVGALVYVDSGAGKIWLFVGAAALWAAALFFGQLTVVDRGSDLEMLSGPIPLFRNRIPYRWIDRVETPSPDPLEHQRGRGMIVRGMIDKVKAWSADNNIRISLNGRMLQIATDDPDGLARLIRLKIRSQNTVRSSSD